MRRMYSENQIKELVDGQIVGKQDVLTLTSVEDGTIVKAIGFDSDGDIVKGTISGGTQLYKHEFRLYLFDFDTEVLSDTVYIECQVISTKSTSFVRSDFESGNIEWNFISIKGQEWHDNGDDEVEQTGAYVVNVCNGDEGAFLPCVITLAVASSNNAKSELYGFSGTIEDSVNPL